MKKRSPRSASLTAVLASMFHILTASLLCVTIFAPTTSEAQSQSPVSASSETATSKVAVPFSVEIKKAVAYVEADCLKEGKLDPHSATAFFLIKPDERLGKDRGFQYLVTNRHVAQPGIENGTPCQVVNYLLKLNLRSNDSAHPSVATVFQFGPHLPWVFPDDPSVDLAIIPFGADQAKVDFEAISTAMLATDDIVKANGIAEGDPVVFTGLFIQVPGLVRIEPIVRQGSIAMMPDEPISTTLNRPGSLYLADVHVFGGNSGAPMFVNLGGFRHGGIAGNNYKLLGVVSGYEREDANFNLQAATTYSGKVGMNSGVASVVPARELDALVNSPQLQKMRDDAIAQMK